MSKDTDTDSGGSPDPESEPVLDGQEVKKGYDPNSGSDSSED